MKLCINQHSKPTSTIILLLAGLLFSACKERFAPPINESSINYLVVEGLINVGADSTIFSLSRTYKLDGKAVVGIEKAAIVQVESEAGTTYVLPETARPGRYGRPALGLDATKKYRLRIRTKDNKEYLSDFVESRISPPVDNVKFDLRNNSFNVYADTHDDTGKSRYYLYNAIETWEYKVPTVSYFKVENKQILPRIYPDDFISNCWHTVPTGSIVVGSTDNLAKDELTDKQIVSLPYRSAKLLVEYSILVKQTVLTREGFEFWDRLRKNTQSVGSIFDAQPSVLESNIRSTTNPADVVIGFISAGTETERRLIVKPTDLTADWTAPPPVDCFTDLTLVRLGLPVQSLLTGPDKPLYIPVSEVYAGGTLIGYEASITLKCVDCRLQGGTNKRPPWKQ